MSGYLTCLKHTNEAFTGECPACLREKLESANLQIDVLRKTIKAFLDGWNINKRNPDDSHIELCLCALEEALEDTLKQSHESDKR